MEYLDLLRQFDGKALIMLLLAWAALFSQTRAWRWKRAYLDVETAYTALAKENVSLRAKRQQRNPDLEFTCAPGMYK